MRSINDPCGQRSTLISPAINCRWVSGLVPMCVATRYLTSLASMRRPMPTPGRAVSLAITVKSLRPWRTSSPIIRCGDPTPMKPPIINDAPSGIISTAAVSPIVLCMILLSLCYRGRAISELSRRRADRVAARRSGRIHICALPAKTTVPPLSARHTWPRPSPHPRTAWRGLSSLRVGATRKAKS